MHAQTLFVGTPEDLEAALSRALAPLLAQMQELQKAQQHFKPLYTVNELAQVLGYSPQTIRRFICEGRPSRKGKLVTLNAKEITKGDYRITASDLNLFLSYF